MIALYLAALFCSGEVAVDADEIRYDAKTHSTIGRDVTLTLPDGSKLMSRCAKFDSDRLEGVATEGSEGEPVVYTGLFEGPGGEKAPFVMRAQEIAVKTEGGIKAIAKGDVRISYGNSATARGSYAEYDETGVLLAGEKAHILHGEGVEFFAKSFRFRKGQEVVEATEVTLSPSESSDWQMHAKRALWDRSAGRIECFESAWALFSGGSLRCEGKSVVELEESLTPQKIFLEGEIYADFQEALISCPGKLLYLPQKEHLEARAKEGKTLTLREKKGTLEASYARLKLEGTKGVEKALVKGDVKLCGLSFFPGQFALAEEMRVDLKGKRALLKSSDASPVLFVDQAQQLQMCAPKISLAIDNEGKPQVKAQGAVRLNFSSDEKRLMETLFLNP